MDLPETTWQSVIVKIAAVVGGAALVGTGTMVISTVREVDGHELRLKSLEAQLSRIPEIDRNVIMLSGKLDVVNQKLDDAKAYEHDRVR